MDQRVLEVVRTLEHDWNKPLCVNCIASNVNLSRSRLRHLFK